MEVVIKALGLTGELPLAAAFVILALYTYSAGLRAPALIAFVKDIMIYIVVLVAVVLVPAKLGGYGAVFASAHDAFAIKGGATGLTLKPAQFLPFATLAIGSALAAFMYPHTLTGIFAARSADTIRKNAVFLPAYTVLLGLIALLGFMAYAAGIKVTNNNDVVPALFNALFPSWFTGFAFSAIAIGALVPAAVMSIGAANLFTRNFWKPYVAPDLSHAGEEKVAKVISLIVKAGALVFILFLPTKFALDLQLLGGVWIVQTFPSVVFGLFNISNRFRAPALLAGWAAGMIGGSWLAFSDGIKPVHTFVIGGDKYTIYTGLAALAFNIIVAVVVQLLMGKRGRKPLRCVRRADRRCDSPKEEKGPVPQGAGFFARRPTRSSSHRKGNPHSEGRAVFRRLHIDRPAMRLHNAAADIQAKPDAGGAPAVVRPCCAGQRIEQGWKSGGRYGVALVRNGNRHLPIAPGGFDGDPPRPVAHRVGQ